MVELMCPIKNKSSLEACQNNADAVYFSVSGLSMRSKANNISLEELPQFISLCHKKKIKAYLTLNSLIYNSDLEKAEKIIKKAKKAKVDALIIWNLALIDIAKSYNLDFFISTQANVSNFKEAEFYRRLGAKRVVLARELTLEQIKEIKEKSNIEIEVFVHGAMCLAISGRCFLSSYFENKSANKGSCKQLCRREWSIVDKYGDKIGVDSKYFLSPKDLCMIEYIPELIEAGIDAFKIEGRQRDPKYIETTSRIYKKAIKSYYNKTFSRKKALGWKKELMKVYNRKFSTGFYFGEPQKEGINFNFSGNASSIKKYLLGKVDHYYSKNKVATLILKHQSLEVGERISIEGETTYFEQEVKSMEVDKEKRKKAEKNEEVGIKLKERARINDNIFLIKD